MSSLLFVIILLSLIFFYTYLLKFSRTLYLKKYGQHVIFEPVESHAQLVKSKWYLLKTITTALLPNIFMLACGVFIVYLLSPAGGGLIMDPETGELVYLDDFNLLSNLSLLLNGYMAGILTDLIATIIDRLYHVGLFKYAIKHPENITGTTRLKWGFTRRLQLSQSIMYIIPLLVLCIAYPTYFMIGATTSYISVVLYKLIVVMRLPAH